MNLFSYFGETAYEMNIKACAQSWHTPDLFSPLSQSCLWRNWCNYRVLRLWLLQARPWGSDISTSIPLLSSFLALQASSIVLYRSCFRPQWGPRLAVKLYQLNDWPFLLLTLAVVSQAAPHCVNGVDTHRHPHTHTHTNTSFRERSKQD